MLLDIEGGGEAGGRLDGWGVVHDHVVVFQARLGMGNEPQTTILAWPGVKTCLFFACDGAERGSFLPDLPLEPEGGGAMRGAGTRKPATEPLAIDGRPIRVAGVPTFGRSLPALSRRAMLEWLRRRFTPRTDRSRFRQSPVETGVCGAR